MGEKKCTADSSDSRKHRTKEIDSKILPIGHKCSPATAYVPA